MLQNKFLYFFLGVTLVFAPAQAVKILVLSDVAITNYYGAMAQAGCEKAVQEFGNSVTDSCDFVTDVAGTEAALRSHLSDDSYDHWVLASSSYGKRFAKVAADFPHRTVSVATRAVTEAPNAQGAIFSEDQAGFLAGALAGLTTQSGTVGVLGGQPNDAVRKYVNGYVMGVLHTCPSCRVVRRYALSFTDPAEGQQLAEELIAEGADVVFGAGGATGSAGIAKAAADQVFVIGVDVDESNNPPFDDNLNVEYEYILSSALKRVDQSVYWSLKDRLTGKWVGLNRVMDATNKGIGMAKAKSPTALGAMAQVKSLALAGAGDVCPKSISRTK
ncbi:basic membrane lipoprotein [Gaertneriomyces semiglobifer]|nr:basic membrane lipoprotein [Gaertneriomyces semiglobifer]